MIFPDCNQCAGTGEARELLSFCSSANLGAVIHFNAWRGNNPDGQPPLHFYKVVGCRKCAARTREEARDE